jgi:hypothetical protein
MCCVGFAEKDRFEVVLRCGAWRRKAAKAACFWQYEARVPSAGSDVVHKGLQLRALLGKRPNEKEFSRVGATARESGGWRWRPSVRIGPQQIGRLTALHGSLASKSMLTLMEGSSDEHEH